MKNKSQLVLGFALIAVVLVLLFNVTLVQALFVMLAGGGLVQVFKFTASRKSSCTLPTPSAPHLLGREQ
jgi:aspartate oxidase